MKVTALSRAAFDLYINELGLDDTNVEERKDMAFISISHCGHIFNSNHSNVLNQEFDDITEDCIYNKVKLRAMTQEQAAEMLEFIESNIGKEFVIHCYAGVSRSQAVRVFITAMYQGYAENDISAATPNVHVLAMLKRAYYELAAGKPTSLDVG